MSTETAIQVPQNIEALGPFFNALYGAEPAGAFVEVRHRLLDRPGMGRRFFEIHDTLNLNEYLLKLGQRNDLYVGVAPRSCQKGTRDAIERVHVLWADCDGPDALDALRRFSPRPAIVVRSGSPDSVHAYWPLYPAATPDEVEDANRKLAHALGADSRSTDAARILRPPGTLNFKGDEPALVELAHLEVEIFTLADVVGKLSDPPGVVARLPRAPREHVPGTDPLLDIEPAVYVEILTGREVGRDGKVRCPFHDDGTPSMHVYDTPEKGVHCFGCGKGSGTIYDFAAEVSGIATRGADFKRLQTWIAERLLNTPVAA